MGSFREEISRLTAQHFSLARIKDKTSKLARELERLMNDAPGAIVSATLVICGTMLVLAPLGGRHHILGEAMVIAGIFGTLLV